MSDPIKHECGIALVRLLKPLQYYEQKYGTPLYGFNKLFLLMEKQHNRGQDGAGIGAVKLNVPPGQPYMFREREIKSNSLMRIFKAQLENYEGLVKEGLVVPEFAPTVKEHFDFGAEVLLGHLRYGTSGAYSKSSCHPYFRRSNWPTKSLIVCGNFNMTNTEALNRSLISRGQHPIFDTDTQTILEEIGFHLDEEHTRIYREMRDKGIDGEQIPSIINEEIDLSEILKNSAQIWDGGYTIAGMVGNGDAFVMRDPRGIRPCFYFADDEFIAFASERVPLMTVFNKEVHEVEEVRPGCAMIVRHDGTLSETKFGDSCQKTSCSFERIYFSRGNDPDIYRERKALGGVLAPQILHKIGGDLQNTVFSYIPNTAETAYYGLMEALRVHRRHEVKSSIMRAHKGGTLTEEVLDDLILNNWPRGEKVAHKDIKLRTFISQEKSRGKMVPHVYDITYEIVKPTDSLVVIDDSIVRGTTLRQSILKILTRTQPTRIVIASTAPQIRYPDCYGIDMSELGKFVAFQAAISLLKKQGKRDVIQDVYQRCVAQAGKPHGEMENHVKLIYEPFTAEEISAQISAIVYPKDVEWKGDIDIIFQTIENLHGAIPAHSGDWYFTGRYPTPGGYAVLNQAFINYYENRDGRAYDVPSQSRSNAHAQA